MWFLFCRLRYVLKFGFAARCVYFCFGSARDGGRRRIIGLGEEVARWRVDIWIVGKSEVSLAGF